jgi:hypothetical protein
MSDDERNFDDVIAEGSDEGNFGGLAKLLQLSSQLEDLEIHQYHLDVGVLSHDEMLGERVLQRVVEMDTLPKLKRIELRGLHVREADLLAFIQRIGARRIFMYNVLMSSGTFRSVFNYCTSEMAGVEELYIDKLFERELGFFSTDPGIPSSNHWLALAKAAVLHLKRMGLRSYSKSFTILREMTVQDLQKSWSTDASGGESMDRLPVDLFSFYQQSKLWYAMRCMCCSNRVFLVISDNETLFNLPRKRETSHWVLALRCRHHLSSNKNTTISQLARVQLPQGISKALLSECELLDYRLYMMMSRKAEHIFMDATRSDQA